MKALHAKEKKNNPHAPAYKEEYDQHIKSLIDEFFRTTTALSEIPFVDDTCFNWRKTSSMALLASLKALNMLASSL